MNLQVMLQHAYQGAFHLTEVVAPALAHRWAVRLFVHPMKYKRPAREVALLQDAAIEECHFAGFYPRPAAAAYYVKYSWGSGPTVLLVHGWAGRGSQLAPLVAPLVNAGYRVVAFDAPAHGDSPGDRTNLLEVSNLIRTLSQEYAALPQSSATHLAAWPRATRLRGRGPIIGYHRVAGDDGKCARWVRQSTQRFATHRCRRQAGD
ncbi:MAG: alpha/beta fold hydrolase [Caldilineaceae bacterium]